MRIVSIYDLYEDEICVAKFNIHDVIDEQLDKWQSYHAYQIRLSCCGIAWDRRLDIFTHFIVICGTYTDLNIAGYADSLRWHINKSAENISRKLNVLRLCTPYVINDNHVYNEVIIIKQSVKKYSRVDVINLQSVLKYNASRYRGNTLIVDDVFKYVHYYERLDYKITKINDVIINTKPPKFNIAQQRVC